ncbi:MAG TPA: hypothetical protein PKC08_10725 [Pseudomonadales bacterium]|nr:hypothetical protein [Pseudomonadales bacterium]
MTPKLDELFARIRALQDEVEDAYREAREEFEQQKLRLAEEFLRRQRRYRTGVIRFVASARPLVLLTAPMIYLGWLPFIVLDLFVTLCQTVCFPVWRIPKVKRSDYLFFDRADLPYLNVIERFNCFYCSYANGIAAYAREVAARTEQYWCPIKHARRIVAAHDRYPLFFEHGDAEAYRQGLERLRRQQEREILR